MSDTLIGKKLGDYVIQEILGRGGMAHVYRGYDPNLQRFAAVKVIDSRLLSKGHEEEYRARFRREARAIARLTHPNIVGVYQFGEFGPLYYMAMEFIDGSDLGVTLKQNAQTGTRLTSRQIIRIIHDIAGALDYAHAGNVIHRDVKPSNIMVTSDERAVLTDFGLALDVPEGTGGNTFGSAHYIAPEQAISSRNAVPQSDLYSLGVVLYQMVTGKVPFDDNSAMSVALKHLSDPPMPPRMVDPNISVAVERVILKSLEKEPSKRFKNGEIMARALEEALETAPIDLTDSINSGSRPSRASVVSSTTNSKRSTREMEAIGSQTIQFADKDVSVARAAILRAKDRNRSQPVLIAIGLTIIALMLLGIFAIIREEPPVTPTAIAAAASPSVESAIVDVTSEVTVTETATDTPSPTEAAAVTEAVSPDVTTSVTPSETASPTDTDIPIETSTSAATDIDAATSTDTPTGTDVPVSATRRVSPTRRPSATASPTMTPISRTDSLSGGDMLNPQAPLVLVYDNDQLVLLNRSTDSMNISGLVFMQRTANGLISFEATVWSTDLLTAIPAGDCLMLWRIGTREAPTPGYCHERQAWFAVGTPRRFWLNSDAAATFDVYNFGIVVATCPVNLGDCGLET